MRFELCGCKIFRYSFISLLIFIQNKYFNFHYILNLLETKSFSYIFWSNDLEKFILENFLMSRSIKCFIFCTRKNSFKNKLLTQNFNGIENNWKQQILISNIMRAIIKFKFHLCNDFNVINDSFLNIKIFNIIILLTKIIIINQFFESRWIIKLIK